MAKDTDKAATDGIIRIAIFLYFLNELSFHGTSFIRAGTPNPFALNLFEKVKLWV